MRLRRSAKVCVDSKQCAHSKTLVAEESAECSKSESVHVSLLFLSLSMLKTRESSDVADCSKSVLQSVHSSLIPLSRPRKDFNAGAEIVGSRAIAASRRSLSCFCLASRKLGFSLLTTKLRGGIVGRSGRCGLSCSARSKKSLYLFFTTKELPCLFTWISKVVGFCSQPSLRPTIFTLPIAMGSPVGSPAHRRAKVPASS